MKMNAAGDTYQAEYGWEVLGYWLDENSDLYTLPYCLWQFPDEQTGAATLHVSNTEDQQETIDLRSRAEIDEFIARLQRARDELFPKF